MMLKFLKKTKAQTAVEYMILLAVVVSIVLVGFRIYLKRTNKASDMYFNNVVTGIVGKPSMCGDLDCDPVWESQANCCVDCPPCGAILGP